MKILNMRLPATNLLLVILCLLHIGICLATNKLVPAQTDKKGLRVSWVSCRGRKYDEKRLHGVILDALHQYRKTGEIGRKYIPKNKEFMPIRGPFYYSQLYSPRQFVDNYRDFVVYSRDGKFAKSVSGWRKNPGSPWYFEDCHCSPLMVPDEGKESDF